MSNGSTATFGMVERASDNNSDTRSIHVSSEELSTRTTPRTPSKRPATEPIENEDSEKEEVSAQQRRGKLLKDAHGYYILDANSINSLLDVRKYIESWPLIPAEELHASSVQHPSYPHFRWLLHTRRVRTHTAEQASPTDAREPPCAGIGIKEEPVWMCRSCMQCLCRPEPIMPGFALANWNWGGRLHPQYKDLNVITKSLLGLATMICRLIVLQHSEHAEDQEKGSEWFLIKSCHC